MRLIDADRLYNIIKDEVKSAKKIGYTEEQEKWINQDMDLFMGLISEQPTVNQWVACSERLPESVGSTVLIKFKDSYKGITTDNGYTCDISWLNDKEKGFVTHEGWMPFDEVIAWMKI